jgi:ribose transport system permease protein
MDWTKVFKHNERELSLFIALVVMTGIFTAINPIYIKLGNLRDIVDNAAIYGLMALGTTFVIISGGINLSIGSALAFVAVIVAKILVAGFSPIVAVGVGLLVGLGLGTVDGLLVTKMKLQPFIATLGTMSLYRGLAFVITEGLPVSGIPRGFRQFINGEILNFIPVPIAILLIATAVGYVVLKCTRFGSYVYAIGGNEEATRLSGVNVERHKTLAYAVGTVGTALAALIMVARLGTGEPTAGQGYELNAIAAVAIGGTSMVGGSGGVVGTLLGALLFSGLKTGLIVAGVDTFYQYIATGLVIITAAYIEVVQNGIKSAQNIRMKEDAEKKESGEVA